MFTVPPTVPTGDASRSYSDLVDKEPEVAASGEIGLHCSCRDGDGAWIDYKSVRESYCAHGGKNESSRE